MSSRVTLGGERLGSGNKMKVDLHGFERSTFDLSYIWRSTMSAGTLVPFLKEVALPGDTFDIHLNCDIKTHPTVGPLFGSYKVQLDVFSVPIRLYHSALHNNRLGIGMNMAQIKLPKLYLTANRTATTAVPDLDNANINPSCIMSYLGIRGVGTAATASSWNDNTRKFNAVPFLAYWDIYKNYYANKQEEIGYQISNSLLPIVATVTSIQIGGSPITQIPTYTNVEITGYETIDIAFSGAAPNPQTIMVGLTGEANLLPISTIAASDFINTGANLIATFDFAKMGSRRIIGWRYLSAYDTISVTPTLNSFPLENIDLMRDAILSSPWNAELSVNAVNLEPYKNVLQKATLGTEQYTSTMYNQEGLAIKTYQSDLLNNWLSTEWIDGTGGINEITAIDTTSGSFNIDTLNLSKKVYDMLNRIAVSGGTYNDWVSAQYDQDVWNRAESPVYCGGLIKELVFQEVVSNSQSEGTEGSQPLGTLAGKGVMSNKHKGGTVVIKVSEPSYIMGLISLTPRIDYSQGNKWDINLDTINDLHVPSLDQIGFQESINEQRAWWSTHRFGSVGPADIWIQSSAGKVPAWLNYMTNVNEVRGNFAINGNEMFMTLNRRFEPVQTADGEIDIKDLTTYIDPAKFNHIFAQTSLDAQNFWTQISIDMTARRKMSSKVMPNV